MRIPIAKTAIRLFIPVLVAMGGCGPDQCQRLERARRKCEEHVQQLKQELLIVRDEAASLKNEVAESRQQLSRKDEEIARLKREREGLLARLRALGNPGD